MDLVVEDLEAKLKERSWNKRKRERKEERKIKKGKQRNLVEFILP